MSLSIRSISGKKWEYLYLKMYQVSSVKSSFLVQSLVVRGAIIIEEDRLPAVTMTPVTFSASSPSLELMAAAVTWPPENTRPVLRLEVSSVTRRITQPQGSHSG